jgi:protein-tyrosine phosphatase
VIDIHSHILPGLDDGAKTWEESLEMARQAVRDGIRVMVATPHLFKGRVVDPKRLNGKKEILDRIEEFKERLSAAGIALEVLPGCDVPLSIEALRLLEDDLLLTINDLKRYLLLELPDTSIPPATEEICFRIISTGITPIITHPERHLIIPEAPDKLMRLVNLGCLAQLTAGSLTGRFGRQVARTSRNLIKKGYIHLLASDAHDPKSRPPLLSPALDELAGLVGQEQARAMVSQVPEKIIHGEPCSFI